MSKNSFICRLFNNKLFLIIISLLISTVIWIYVASLQTEEFQQTFRGVRVELSGEDYIRENRNLVITDLDVSTVTVTVTGPRRIVASLSASDLSARLDVSKLTQPAYTSQTYSIIFPDGIDKSNIKVTYKTPEIVNFMVSKLTSKTIPVRGSFNNEPADGYVAETPVFSPSVVTVYGPEVYLKDISYAWVTFSQENVSTTYSVETGYTLMDENGESCSSTDLTFSDEIITATLPILATKEVPLSVNVINAGGTNDNNLKIEVNPKSVLLAGDSAVLANISKIVLHTIDLSEFASSFQDIYPITIDTELSNLSGVYEAEVSVSVIGLETKNFDVSNLSCANVTDGYSAEIIADSIHVVLRGTAEVLETIKSENIRAVVDLTDFDSTTGIFLVNAKIYIDGYNSNEVGAIFTNQVSVEIKKVSS